ncbi:class I SAM-dependent methyltransferase [Paenibacillus rhizovicinus]|uniref:Class I SAM-dependent methyltransferase n=1 Tax=Paenibacillus rhizovicinus TaxID=2704463 RepID=A0A6C0P286_9BACL|nr:class I SAM-dependent methyltransferase [Paenibacillus rhizovicinus]QHW32608.1 class I SAM-dependent methyltransferase [Paenibacillus rhizovicinus]
MKAFDEMWEQIHKEQEWGKYPGEEVIRFVARNYFGMDRSETTLLEVGCGTGAVTWFMGREGFKVSAFDGSKTAVAKAQARLKEEGLLADVQVVDATAMPYSNDHFDGIVDSAMIYANKVDAIRTILGECYRVLKPGGKLFSTGLFKVGMTGYGTGEKLEEHTFRELTEGALAHRGTAHFFDQDEIIKLWSEAGFKNLKIDSVDRTDRGGTVHVSYYMVESEK